MALTNNCSHREILVLRVMEVGAGTILGAGDRISGGDQERVLLRPDQFGGNAFIDRGRSKTRAQAEADPKNNPRTTT